MNKEEILREIFEIENISDKIKKCPLITEELLFNTILPDKYNLNGPLGISPNTITKYLKILFPDRKGQAKPDVWLLYKYGYKMCTKCDTLKYLEDFHKAKATWTGLNAYCAVCMNKLTAVTAVERQAKYRAAKLNRSPQCMTLEDFKEISIFYANCPEGYQVDHIIPLQGEKVSGLHIGRNLQYLTPFDNMSKGNR